MVMPPERRKQEVRDVQVATTRRCERVMLVMLTRATFWEKHIFGKLSGYDRATVV